jgi:hypothetical protein
VAQGRERVLSRSARHPDPPPPPDTLDPPGCELFCDLWALPVSQLWEPWQADEVARLVELQLLREGGERKGWVYSGTANLRTALFLTPKALKATGAQLEGAALAPSSRGDDPFDRFAHRIRG